MFSVLTIRLFSVNHVCKSVITLFSLYWRLFIFSSVTNMFVSSANNTIFASLFVVRNKHFCTKNLEVHNHDTRSANNFHLLITNLTKYQKGAHYAGIKILIIFILT